MISVIVCSISPSDSEIIRNNIRKTIGRETEYEVIIWDNRASNKSIASVYNICAEKAAGDNLLFLHQDVEFLSEDWGKVIEAKLQEPDCGVIGFAGSIVKPAVYSGWFVNKKYERSHYWFLHDGVKTFNQQNFPAGENFTPVVTLDGLALFVKKSVHKMYPFDEKNLIDFHCYDLDYTLEIARHFKNYCSNIELIHKSNGSFNLRWVVETIKMHDMKWNSFLPVMIDGVSFSQKEMEHINDDALWAFFKSSYRFLSPRVASKNLIIYCRLPFSPMHARRTVSGILKITRLLINRIKRKIRQKV